MYFNNFRPGFPSTLPSFGAVLVGGGFRPSFGFGGAWGGMNNWLGNQFMGFGCQGMNNWFRPPQHRPGWSWQNQHQWNHQGHWHHGHGPVVGHRPPHSHGPSGAGGCHAMRDGGWDSSAGGYRVGPSGELQVTIQKADADFNNKIQYRTENGEWKDLGWSKETGKNETIQARPGSTVEFRIQTPQGNNFQAGTTANSDGQDHGKVSANADGGVRVGFEDYANDTSFNDAIIDIKDVPRRW